MSTPADAVLFSETQRFRQWWILLLLFGMFALSGGIVVQQVVFHHPVGNNPLSNTGAVLLFMLLGLTLPGLFLAMNLTTEVRRDGLYVRFFPFHLQFFRVEGIQQAQACEYSPMGEYGGWGIRYGATGKAFNVQGNQGVRLALKSGQTLLIGSLRTVDLEQAISTALKLKKA